jgi:transketolase
MHTIKPIDETAIIQAVADTRRLITFEDHNIHGGLGSAVADGIAASGKGCAFEKVGIPDCFCEVGYPEDLYSLYKLDTDGIIEKVREVMGRDFEEDDDWEDEV